VKIGIFGGTFDPPHIGHLIAAQDACMQLALDRVLFVPAGQPPHKLDQKVSPPELRLEMLTAALADDERFQVSQVELRRAGPSYMVDTLRELRRDFSGDDLFLLLGADQVRELHTWREPEEVARLAHIVLISRTGVVAVPQLQVLVGQSIEVTRIDVSATQIRHRIAAGQPIRYLVPPAVEQIIRRRGLYQPSVLARNEAPKRG
jgi:nicotinate-nucleotide adenylyltransferase